MENGSQRSSVGGSRTYDRRLLIRFEGDVRPIRSDVLRQTNDPS